MYNGLQDQVATDSARLRLAWIMLYYYKVSYLLNFHSTYIIFLLDIWNGGWVGKLVVD
jgi:hypothetical protein